MSAFYDIMSVFLGWQIICYLCAGLINILSTTADVDKIDAMATHSIFIRKGNI